MTYAYTDERPGGPRKFGLQEDRSRYYLVPGRREKIIASGKARRQRAREYVRTTKVGKSCTRCEGLFPPVVLDYHHLDPTTKHLCVGDMVGRGRSNEDLQAEIDKCELICANCHRIETHPDD